MRQFYKAYCDTPKLSTLLRELPWSSHLHILSGSKLAEAHWNDTYTGIAT